MEINFKVGDIVTIRQWKDMALDYCDGLMSYNFINPDQDIYFSFSDPMREYCGRKLKIYDSFRTTDIWAFDMSDNQQPVYRLADEAGNILPPFFHEWMFEEYKGDDYVLDLQALPEYQIDFLLT